MAKRDARSAPNHEETDLGIWRGQSVARRFVSPDGMIVLVGKQARDNDILTFKIASPRDFWFHVAAESGSHVLVRNPDGLDRLPKETRVFAAALAAGYSKARHGGKVAVHYTRCSEISKPRGFAPGKVSLRRYESMRAAPFRGTEDEPEKRGRRDRR